MFEAEVVALQAGLGALPLAEGAALRLLRPWDGGEAAAVGGQDVDPDPVHVLQLPGEEGGQNEAQEEPLLLAD